MLLQLAPQTEVLRGHTLLAFAPALRAQLFACDDTLVAVAAAFRPSVPAHIVSLRVGWLVAGSFVRQRCVLHRQCSAGWPHVWRHRQSEPGVRLDDAVLEHG